MVILSPKHLLFSNQQSLKLTMFFKFIYKHISTYISTPLDGFKCVYLVLNMGVGVVIVYLEKSLLSDLNITHKANFKQIIDSHLLSNRDIHSLL